MEYKGLFLSGFPFCAVNKHFDFIFNQSEVLTDQTVSFQDGLRSLLKQEELVEKYLSFSHPQAR